MSIGLQLNIFYWFKSFNKSLSSSCIISFSTFFYVFNFSVWHLLYTIICAFYYFMYSVSILWLFSFYALEFVLKYSDLMFCKKGVLKNFAKFTGKHLCQIFFFNKVASQGQQHLFYRTTPGYCFCYNYLFEKYFC